MSVHLLQVVPRSTSARREARKQRIREYFYGRDRSLSPSLTTVSFDDVQLWRIGGNQVRRLTCVRRHQALMTPLDAPPPFPTRCQVDDAMVRPVGAESALDPVRVEAVSPEKRLEHSVLAVSCSQTQEGVNETNVAGFVVV